MNFKKKTEKSAILTERSWQHNDHDFKTIDCRLSSLTANLTYWMLTFTKQYLEGVMPLLYKGTQLLYKSKELQEKTFWDKNLSVTI